MHSGGRRPGAAGPAPVTAADAVLVVVGRRDKYAVTDRAQQCAQDGIACTCDGLSPTSTVAGMAAGELRAALSYSLVNREHKYPVSFGNPPRG